MGPNIVPAGVVVIRRGREGRRWSDGEGVTAALANVSDSVWGSFGYQGAAGVHSVVFRS